MSEDFQFDGEELAELRALFFEQATEVIESLGELILRVERNPSDAETLRSIRRAVHTLKGDSMAFGFTELTSLAHHYEDALDRVRASGQSASRGLIDLLLAGADALAALVRHYRGDGPAPETARLVAGLDALKDGEKEPAAQPPVAPVKPVAPEPPPVAAASPDALTTVSAIAETAQAEHSSEPLSGVAEDRRQSGERRKSEMMTLRIESERIDAAMNLVGELIIQRSMIATLASEIEAVEQGDELTLRLSEAVALSGRTLSELQESVMRMRLVAIDQVFRRFPRVVRDASVKLGKPLRLEIEGGETEIDKSVVEIISDPLIHLIRNACDHGIEPPEVRRATGKAEEGVIRLRARRAGNQIAVDVEDDGGGIDPARIVAKAMEKGLITQQEVADWTDQQKIGLIFMPEFSTKQQVSDLSGRGVGMDVVKTSTDKLGGSVTVNSVIGRGSRFTIKLPLTMAIVRAMMFESLGCRFAVPLDAIREITNLRPGEARTINGREVLRLRDRVLPLLRVDEALGLRSPADRDLHQRVFVLIVDLGDGRDVGLAVERLYGEQELVLKSLDHALTQSPMVAGASILGDGNVVLILDPLAVANQAVAQNHDAASRTEAELVTR